MADIYRHISSTIKALRKDRGWSLDKTAKETGVSKAMLGQIEREESSPTIATLWKIANGFNTPFSTFIADIHLDAEEPLHSFSKTITLPHAETKIKVCPLFSYDKKLHFEIFLIELLPGCEHLSTCHKPGVIEHVIVASGQMEVLVDGAWVLLNQGEGLRFHASQPHGYRNNTQEVTVIHNIIHYTSP